MNIKHLTKDVGRFVAEQSPQILTVLAVAGTGATAYFVGKATFKAADVINEETFDKQEDGSFLARTASNRNTKQKALLVWKLYIPAATTGVMTVVCIVAANRVQARRMAALAAAYGILSGDFDEYRTKALELLGVKKAEELESGIAAQKIGNAEYPLTLPAGKSWFLDMSTMRPFPSTMETVKAAQNKINFQCINQQPVALNEFYELLDLDPTSIGDILGWNEEKRCDLTFLPILTDDKGAVTAVRFTTNPVPKF